jgi:hypothetical protein
VALSALATVADLVARGVDTSNGTRADAFLAAASAAVRAAAGHPISRVTSTVRLLGRTGPWLPLPAGPVTAVAAVLLDGTAVTDWTLYPDDRLFRPTGAWITTVGLPSIVTVTQTHGYLDVDEDIVDLVCGLAAGALAAAAAGGYDPGIGVQSVRVDDASETYVTGADARAGHMELPQSTRDALAARFGGSSFVVGAGSASSAPGLASWTSW